MTMAFDMEVFLAGILTGSSATQQRHLRQAKLIHAAIAERWQCKTPWAWKRKYLVWFFQHPLNQRSEATRYYYLLTVRFITIRLKKSWVFKL